MNQARLRDAIESVLARRDEWPKLLAQARRYVVTERTWTRSVAHYVDVYASLCAARDGCAASALGRR